MSPSVTTVVFDLGGVLVDWNPRYLYRDLFKGDEAAMEHFLSAICTPDWNDKQDAGRSFAEAAAELKAQHAAHAEMIDAWFPGFDKMLAGPIHGTVEILTRLHQSGMPLYALTNWSDETFPIAQQRFDFLRFFQGILVSGRERLAKPDPQIFELLIARYNLTPAQTVYIDDNALNIETARGLGFHALPFTTPQALADDLRRFDLSPLQRCA